MIIFGCILCLLFFVPLLQGKVGMAFLGTALLLTVPIWGPIWLIKELCSVE